MSGIISILITQKDKLYFNAQSVCVSHLINVCYYILSLFSAALGPGQLRYTIDKIGHYSHLQYAEKLAIPLIKTGNKDTTLSSELSNTNTAYI